MKLKTCEYCGTEYGHDQQQCPLCGKAGVIEAPVQTERPDVQQRASGQKGGARLAPKGKVQKNRKVDEDRIPRWMWVLICVFLGLSVLIGALYFCYDMGFFSRDKEQTQTEETQQNETQQEQQPETQEDPDQQEQQSQMQPDDSSEVVCTALTLSQTAVTLDEQGGHIFLTAVARPADCTQPITYLSTDEAVVTVNNNGMITAIAPGVAEVRVICGDITEICTVTCEFELVPDVTVNPNGSGETNELDEQQPSANDPVVVAQDGSDAYLSSTDFTLFTPGEQTTIAVHDAPAGANITFVSSNSNVATVTGTGQVTAVGSGTATITVTVNQTTLKCIARCSLGGSTENSGGTTVVVGNCTISHTDVTLGAGESFKLTLKDDSGNEVTGESWYTNNAVVCTVDGSGNVKNVGSGTATVSTVYGGKTYECIVRCK